MLAFLLSITDEKSHDKIIYLYKKYHRRALRLAEKMLRGTSNTKFDAEDAVGEAFVKIVKNISYIDFSRTDEEIEAYICRTVKNECFRFLALFSKDNENTVCTESCEDIAVDDDALEKLCEAEEMEIIIKAILSLEENYRTVLYMHLVDELKPNDIALQLGIPISTVYTNLRRGKVLLYKKAENMLGKETCQ